MTLGREARRALAACLGAFVAACQSLLVFTPNPVANDAGSDAAFGESSTLDGGSTADARSPSSNDGEVPVLDAATGCAQRADAAFCVDFSNNGDLLTPNPWTVVDPNIHLGTDGVTSPPFAARMESTTNGGSNCEYELVHRVLAPTDSARARLAANISMTKGGYPIVLSLNQPGGDRVAILGGIFSTQIQLVLQEAAAGGNQVGTADIAFGAVHRVEMVVEPTAQTTTLSTTLRLLDLAPPNEVSVTLPDGIVLGQVEIILGVYNKCEPTVVTVDDVALWFE